MTQMSDLLFAKVYSESWLRQNEKALIEMFPLLATYVDHDFFASTGYRMQLLGLDWRNRSEKVLALSEIMYMGFAVFQYAERPEPVVAAQRRTTPLSEEEWDRLRGYAQKRVDMRKRLPEMMFINLCQEILPPGQYDDPL